MQLRRRYRHSGSEELGAWRAQRGKEVSAPGGWLSLAGLDWLKTGFNTVGSSADSADSTAGRRACAPGNVDGEREGTG